MRKPAAIVSSLLLMAALTVPLCSQQQSGPVRSSPLLLIIPFENTSNTAGIDWVGEAFPEVLTARFSSSPLFVMTREDRLSAFDRLGIPASAKPSRATIYQVAQQLDADYVLVGDYRVENGALTVRARLIDMARLRLSAELTESGPVADLITIQTALAWDVLHNLDPNTRIAKADFIAQFPALRLDALENYVRGIIATNDQEKIKRFKEVVRLEPSHTLATLHLGKSYYNLRDYESAATWLAKIPANDPVGNEAQFYLGLANFYSGHMDKAEAAFRSLASRLPLTEVYNNLGVVSARRGDRRARGYFEKSVQEDPNEPDYHFNLAVALAREGDNPGAARELREVLVIHPDAEAKTFLEAVSLGTSPSHPPLERIARNYDESSFRQLAQEIENTSEARLQNSDAATHAAFHVQRGLELLDSGLAGEAEKQFREAVVLDPANADAHTGLARVLESTQDNSGARNEARASIKLKPSADAYLVLACVDLAEAKSSAAVQDVEHALAIEPDNPVAISLKRDITAGKTQAPQP
ncbi:MAG TPA: tetratricopeptide repeat protein [Candidatus Angelobacter sp.]|nr:tetratricopeptide repeat protein [Candidatus Angelobacter sp.]